MFSHPKDVEVHAFCDFFPVAALVDPVAPTVSIIPRPGAAAAAASAAGASVQSVSPVEGNGI